MLGATRKGTYFTEIGAVGRFAIYAGMYLAATLTIGCLGLIIESPLLTFLLAMLISNPIVWILMGVTLAVTYKLSIEPLFHLVRDPFKGKNTDHKEQKTPDGSIKSSESKQAKKTQIKTYSTAGNGNCFFHAVFGNNSLGQYKAEKAQEMRLEWHKFLSQFASLDDASMSSSLKAQLGKVFNMFLNKPEDLTGKSDKIKKLAEHTNKKIKKVKRKVEKLIRKLLRIGLPENEVKSNLKELAVSNFFSVKRYDKNYNSEGAANSLLNSELIYKSYLEAISNQSYYVFIEEIPILASLANIEIDVHYQNNGNDVHTVFKPNPEMINEDYQQNNELWGNRERETIYLKPGHYEKAEVMEVASSVLERPRSIVFGLVETLIPIN